MILRVDFLNARLSQITSSTLLRVLSCGKWSSANMLLQQLRMRSESLHPFSFTATAAGAAWMHALKLLKDVTIWSIKLGLQEISLFNIAISATSASAEAWEKAIQLFSISGSLGSVERTSISYNAATGTFVQSVQWQGAMVLLAQLETQANDITFTGVIHACEKAVGETASKFKDMVRSIPLN